MRRPMFIVALAVLVMQCGRSTKDESAHSDGAAGANSPAAAGGGAGGQAGGGAGTYAPPTEAVEAGIPTVPGGSGGATPAGPGGAGGAAAPDAAGQPTGLDSSLAAALASIDPARIATVIGTLAHFTTRNTCSSNTPAGNAIGAAREWVRAEMQSIPGFVVSLHDFTYRGCVGGPVTDQNVVAVKRGLHPERVIVVGGHYDSRAVNPLDPKVPAPGANDSGSQTAAVLEVARALGPLDLDATLMVVAFAGEEQGLVGSAQLAKDFAAFVAPNARVEAMLNMDIVGGDSTVNTPQTLQQFRVYSPGTPRELKSPLGTTDDTSPARGLMRYVATWGAAYVPSMTMLPILREDRSGRGGDHESFNSQGMPAVRFIETIESPNAGTIASHQHSPNDLPAFVTPAYTARIAQIVAAVAGNLARAPAAPQMITASGPAAGPWTLSWSPPASGPAVDHYVVAARSSMENFYRGRTSVAVDKTSHAFAAADLGVTAGAPFFVSVAAVDGAGHESLFAYPEYRCDAAGCAVQAGSLDVTARN